MLADLNGFIKCVGGLHHDVYVSRLTGEESLSSLFSYNITFKSELDYSELGKEIGKPVSFKISSKKICRYVSGLLVALECLYDESGFNYYTAVVVPPVWALTSGKNYRIYQNQSVPEIVEAILKEKGINDFNFSLFGDYLTHEYCMQYDEDDFSFISRLLEESGIYYFFQHQNNKCQMIFADSPRSHTDAATTTIPFLPLSGFGKTFGFTSWHATGALHVNTVTVASFDQNQASTITGEYTSEETQRILQGVAYRCISPHRQQSQLENMARVTSQRFSAHSATFRGESKTWWLQCGEKFVLEDLPSANGHYVIKRFSMALQFADDGGDYEIACCVDVISADTQFRPQKVTPVPCLHGIVTAQVVGPSSEDVYTDEFGRIKIQFFWDANGRQDDSSSCWVPVAQQWAGNRFGCSFIPRTGSEVIVTFMNGHPDYPVVTGMFFNGKNNPPISLPDNKLQSGIVSRTSPDGSIEEGNKFIFNDTKNNEEVLLSAQKNLCVNINNDAIYNIHANYEKKIKENYNRTILEGDQIINVEKGNSGLNVGGNKKTLIEKEVDYKVNGKSQFSFSDNCSITVNKNHVFNIDGNSTTKLSSGNYDLAVTSGNIKVKGGKNVVIESMQSIELKVGSSKVSISQAGVTIEGASVTLKGNATTEIKGAMVSVKGSGMTKVDGGVVIIG